MIITNTSENSLLAQIMTSIPGSPTIPPMPTPLKPIDQAVVYIDTSENQLLWAIYHKLLHYFTTGGGGTGGGGFWDLVAGSTTDIYNTNTGKIIVRVNGANWLHAPGTNNIALGTGALAAVQGFGNIAIGLNAGNLLSEFDGSQSGSRNIFFGFQAGKNATGSSHSVFIGADAGYNASNGSYSNVGIGKGVLAQLTTGFANTAVGSAINTTTGTWNALLGANVGINGTTQSFNSAIGGEALYQITTGQYNNAMGYHALDKLTTGVKNVAIGEYAGSGIITGGYNVFIGSFAGAYVPPDTVSTLVIDASWIPSNAEKLIAGKFYENLLGINKAVGAAQSTLHVGGEIQLENLRSVLRNGQIWYDPGENRFKARENGTTIYLGGSSGWQQGGNTETPATGATQVFGMTTNNDISMVTGGTEVMRLTKTGKVGIKRNSPNSTLDVGGAIGAKVHTFSTFGASVDLSTVEAGTYIFDYSGATLMPVLLADPTTCPGRVMTLIRTATTGGGDLDLQGPMFSAVATAISNEAMPPVSVRQYISDGTRWQLLFYR